MRAVNVARIAPACHDARVTDLASISAVIPAAGRSGRMGATKPLMALGGKTVLDVVLDAFRAAGVGEAIVVTGHDGARLIPVVERAAARWVENPRPERGMFSSVQVGCAAVRRGAGALFIHPADVPLVQPATLRLLAARLAAGGRRIVVPACGGRRGHPPLLDASLVPSLLAYAGDGGLRGFLAAHADELEVVPCDDPGVALDMDTPQDYERIRQRG